MVNKRYLALLQRISLIGRAGGARYFPRMARPLRFSEMSMLRLEPGTTAEIDRLSADGEARADFIRAAIEREIARRKARLAKIQR